MIRPIVATLARPVSITGNLPWPSLGAPLWTPAKITTALWLDANDLATVTLNGATVSQWSDKSGSARHAIQATAANQPTFTLSGLNGKPVLSFGANSILSNSTIPIDDPFSLFAVGRVTGATSSYNTLFRIHRNDAGTSHGFFGSSGVSPANFATFFGNGAAAWNDTNANTPGVTCTTARILGVVNGGATATPYADDVAQNTKVGTMAAATGYDLGASNTPNNQPWNGFIAEIVLVAGSISTANRQKLAGYFAWKWGLVGNLAADHPYKSKPPTVLK